jgi:hypothetical protein
MKARAKWAKFIISAAFLAAALAFLGSPRTALASGAGAFVKAAENGRLALYASPSSGEWYAEDKASGLAWRSNPLGREEDGIARGAQKTDMDSQLLVRIVDTDARTESLLNTSAASVSKGLAEFSLIEGGFRMGYYLSADAAADKDSCFFISMETTLAEDGVVVTLPLGELKEIGSRVFYSVSVLPYFGAGGTGDEGYLFVPDGSGALIGYNNGKQALSAYSQPVYGPDDAFYAPFRRNSSQNAKLPVYGARRNGGAFLAALLSGEAKASINAAVSGARTSFNTVYPEFMLRQSDLYIIGKGNEIRYFEKNRSRLENIAIRYFFLDGGNADYNGMAKRYRRFLLEEGGLAPKAMPERGLLGLTLQGAVMSHESFLGIPVDRVKPLTTFKDAEDILRRYGGAGIADIVAEYEGIARESLSGNYARSFSALSELGGAKGLSALLSYAGASGVAMAPAVDWQGFWKNGNSVSRYSDAIRTLPQSVASQHSYNLATGYYEAARRAGYLLSPPKMLELLPMALSSLKALEFAYISPGELGSRLFSDFGGNRSQRQESQEYNRQALKAAVSAGCGLILESPNLYGLDSAAFVLRAPQSSSGYDIEDASVPFYQLVISGLVPYSSEDINFSASPRKAFLRALETGSFPQYSFAARNTELVRNTESNGKYALNIESWFEESAECYRAAAEIYRRAGAEQSELAFHEQIAAGVTRTVYKNGCEVTVNHADAPATVDGVAIGPLDYAVAGGRP